jgi:CheY-like chemotaxis protein
VIGSGALAGVAVTAGGGREGASTGGATAPTEGRPARVLLGCRRVGEALRIEVKDNGPGIASDKQAVIFDEFVRLQAEDDAPREERGLGLGLAIVDRIARMLDLPVGIASAPGQGSTFSVTVPRVPAVVAAPLAQPAPQPTPSVEAESFVLCIDNEARVRDAMATLLAGWGCRVATAASHAEAEAEVARAGRLPDLVLADLHLDDDPDGLGRRRCAAPGAAPCRRPCDRRRVRRCGCGLGAPGRIAAQAGEACRVARAAAAQRAAHTGGSVSPRASMTAWVRERTPSLRRITVTCAFTVASPTPSL